MSSSIGVLWSGAGAWLLNRLSGFRVSFPLLGTVFLTSRFARKDTTFATGGLFSLGKLVFIRFLVGSLSKAGRSQQLSHQVV